MRALYLEGYLFCPERFPARSGASYAASEGAYQVTSTIPASRQTGKPQIRFYFDVMFRMVEIKFYGPLSRITSAYSFYCGLRESKVA